MALAVPANLQDLPSRPDGAPSLLIIEDDKDMQQLLISLLQGTYQLAITGSATEGLLKAENLGPDLVVCDVMLPDGSGFDIVDALKKNEDTSHIPLILFTAVGDLSGRKTGWEKGADDYIVKPFSSDDLFLRIAGLLGNRKRLQDWYKRKLLYGQGINNGNDQTKEIINTADLEYLAKLENETFTLIDRGDCCLDNLAEAMGQSGRTLQRRLKSLLSIRGQSKIKQEFKINPLN